MRPDLSIENLAITLAALGTSAMIGACARSEPAGARAEPPTPSASAPPAQPMPETATKNEGEKEPSPIATATASSTARPMMNEPRRRAPGDKGSTGQASCGAGTCTADPKKK